MENVERLEMEPEKKTWKPTVPALLGFLGGYFKIVLGPKTFMDFKVLGSKGPGFCLFSWCFFSHFTMGFITIQPPLEGIFVVIFFSKANLRLEKEKDRPKAEIFGSSSCSC